MTGLDEKLTWQYESDYKGNPQTLIYTATLDDSGKIAGSVEVQPFGVTGRLYGYSVERAQRCGSSIEGPTRAIQIIFMQWYINDANP